MDHQVCHASTIPIQSILIVACKVFYVAHSSRNGNEDEVCTVNASEGQGERNKGEGTEKKKKFLMSDIDLMQPRAPFGGRSALNKLAPQDFITCRADAIGSSYGVIVMTRVTSMPRCARRVGAATKVSVARANPFKNARGEAQFRCVQRKQCGSFRAVRAEVIPSQSKYMLQIWNFQTSDIRILVEDVDVQSGPEETHAIQKRDVLSVTLSSEVGLDVVQVSVQPWLADICPCTD